MAQLVGREWWKFGAHSCVDASQSFNWVKGRGREDFFGFHGFLILSVFTIIECSSKIQEIDRVGTVKSGG